MTRRYYKVDCKDCKLCCRFEILNSELFTLEEIQKLLFFNKKLCDIFFYKNEDNKYLIGQECIKFKDNNCTIHGTKDYPGICAIYPFLVVKNRNNKLFITIDKNCPEWKNIIKHEKMNNDFKNIRTIITDLSAYDNLDIFDITELKDCGYKLKKIFSIDM